MKQPALVLAMGFLALPLPADDSPAPKSAEPPSRADRMLADYFRHETTLLTERCLADIRSLDDWQAKRVAYRRQLQEMLGLWPMPERTDLKPVITGRLDHDDVTVEKLHFQASPGLYVTANLWLPKNLTKPSPAILYVCGHSRMITNGVSLGNKTGYQHHGAWFAQNGYVCLTIDTLQLGEIQGLHHGTYREAMWWWNSRGYTPAGVEAWFGIRALDYLCSRPEVDGARIGMTGRSGGGSYSWTVAALDERVKVVAPVAGITDMQNQVVDGCVEGHCDCMFYVNTYRWDFPQLAALVAPRPLLLANTDKDAIFPLDGVVRLHDKVRRIYRFCGETNKLGLLITEGPHADTQDLQVPVLRWFNRWLKGDEPLVEHAAKRLFVPAQLRVFDKLPEDEINTKIHESFVPAAKPAGSGPSHREQLLTTLKEKCFGGWSAEPLPLDLKRVFSVKHEGVRFAAWDFTSQPGVTLRLYIAQRRIKPTGPTVLEVLDAAGWDAWLAAMQVAFADELTEELAGVGESVTAAPASFAVLKQKLAANDSMAWFAPRGVGLDAWSGGEQKQSQIRRRFMLLGQTLDGMRVWDIRRAAQAMHALRSYEKAAVHLRAGGDMGVNALYATLFEPRVAGVQLQGLPKSHREGPDYLNVLKVLNLPEALRLVAGRAVAQ